MKNILILFLMTFSLIAFGQKDSSAVNQDDTQNSSFLISVPFESVNGKMIIKVGMNGKSYRFIFDTGSFSCISKRLFDEINPKISKKIRFSDQSALIDSIDFVTIDTMTLGMITFNNVELGAFKESNPIFECFNVEGFIGCNSLNGFIVQISLPDKTIRFTNNSKNLNLIGSQSDELILDEQFNPHFSIRVQKNKNEVRQVVLFDTGDNDLFTISHVDLLSLKKNKLLTFYQEASGSNSIGMNGHAIDTTHYRIRVPTLNLNGLQLKNVSALTTQGSSRIGSKLLENALVTLDFPNKRYYLQPLTSPKVDVYEKSIPIDPDIRDGKVVVGFIWDYAVCKNMEVGDEILKINAYNFQDMNPCDLLTSEFKFKDAKKVILTTKDKNGVIHSTKFKIN